jgi:hypothetical protein
VAHGRSWGGGIEELHGGAMCRGYRRLALPNRGVCFFPSFLLLWR